MLSRIVLKWFTNDQKASKITNSWSNWQHINVNKYDHVPCRRIFAQMKVILSFHRLLISHFCAGQPIRSVDSALNVFPLIWLVKHSWRRSESRADWLFNSDVILSVSQRRYSIQTPEGAVTHINLFNSSNKNKISHSNKHITIERTDEASSTQKARVSIALNL